MRDMGESHVKKNRKKWTEMLRKGATFYAVSASVNKICTALTSAYDSVSTVSTMFHGEYGIEDVCISTLQLVDRSGVRGRIMNKLTEEEIEKLQKSANKLKSVIAQLEI